jgi:hypothetical protein
MHTQILVRDELIVRAARPPLEFTLSLPANQLTIRDLIRQRVEHEVAAYNAQQPEYYQGLVQPTAAEQTLNGCRMPRQRDVDAGAQVRRALDAFERNGFVILIDDRQVERLDDWVILGPATVVTFLKLVPLVGG